MFDRWTMAWALACLSLAGHIAEEALNGSFGVYSDISRALEFLWPSLNLAPFNFNVWFINIVGALAVLIALTPLVHDRHPLMRAASYAFATFLTANGSLHLYVSVAAGKPLPGSLSAPILLLAGLFLFLAVKKLRAQNA